MSVRETDRSVSHSLLERLRQADSQAWRRMVALFAPAVYGWCRGAGLQPNDAEDIVQEVFKSVHGALDGFQRQNHGHSFRGWLWRITENKIRDFQRRGRRHIAAAGGTEAMELLRQAPADPSERPADSASAKPPAALEALVRKWLSDEFSESAQRVFWATVVENRDAAEVAADMGLTRNNVYVLRSRVLARLRGEFRGLFESL